MVFDLSEKFLSRRDVLIFRTSIFVDDIRIESFQTVSSLKFQKQVKSVFHKYKVEIKPAYTSRKVSNYFNNKSNCSAAFDANVIYKYTCSEDQNISYVGETSRQLFRQIEDHKRSDKNSVIFKLIYNCKSCKNTNINNKKFINK